MSLPPLWNAVLALGAGAAALASVSHLSATATGAALAWVAGDRSEGLTKRMWQPRAAAPSAPATPVSLTRPR